jgi:hypothetical protein
MVDELKDTNGSPQSTGLSPRQTWATPELVELKIWAETLTTSHSGKIATHNTDTPFSSHS